MMVELLTIVRCLCEMNVARSAKPEFSNPCTRGNGPVSSGIGWKGQLQ